MSERAAARLAWALLVLAVGLLAAGAAVNPAFLLQTAEVVLVAPALAFVTVGAFLVSRRPRNPVGWLLLGWGMVMAFGALADTYIDRALVREPGSLPGADWVAWADATIWHPAFALLAFLLLLFPHGRLPSPRWRPFAWLVLVGYGTLAVSAALSPAAVKLYFPRATPVLPTPLAGVADTVFGFLLVACQLGLLGTAVGSLVLRLRRARSEERQQIKWFVYTVAVVVVAFVAGVFLLGGGYLFPLFAAVPVAVAVAVLRYRLYEIDRIINRTLVYTLLTALLGLVYAAGVFLLGDLLDPAAGDSELAVAASTLGVAALFQPARRRLQQLVDRRFNRRRYDAARTVDTFAARLRDQVDLDALTAELLAVAEETMQPTRASLWLRAPG